MPFVDLFFGALAQSSALLYTNAGVSLTASSLAPHATLFDAVLADLGSAALGLAPSLPHFVSPALGSTDALLAYSSFAQHYLDSFVSSVAPAQLYSTLATATPTWVTLILALDPALLVLEVFFVGVVCLSLDKWTTGGTGRQLFYDDLVTLCKYNNLSLTEIAVATTLSVGFVFFDIFVSFAEEDVIDSLNYLILLFVILTFVFLLLAVDVQYFFMVSNAGGDLTFRVICFDLVNNVLCALRVFFCWVRYIFYDLQVELVDLSFHYADSVNETSLLTWFEVNLQNSATWPAHNPNSLISSASALVWSLAAVFLDVALYIFQALAGLFKLVIASFLLWLIVDLFLLRGFALDESHGLTTARARALRK